VPVAEDANLVARTGGPAVACHDGPVAAGPLSEQERAGRRRRGRIIVVVAIVLVVPSLVFDTYADRRADEQAADLAASLGAAAAAVGDVDLLAAQEAGFRYEDDAGTPPLLEALGHADDFRSAGFDVSDEVRIHAVFETGWGRSDRCVHVLMGPDGARTDVRGCS
jgi:hypothetical protein